MILRWIRDLFFPIKEHNRHIRDRFGVPTARKLLDRVAPYPIKGSSHDNSGKSRETRRRPRICMEISGLLRLPDPSPGDL